MKITKSQTISEIIKKYPQTIEIFFKYGLHCIGCAISANETLEEGARGHGLTDKEIAKILREINKIIEH
ncbi:MAG: DUF1858 domain-containing protein [Patescibacteria group bacterium]